MKRLVLTLLLPLFAVPLRGEDLRSGTYYPLNSVPAELIAKSPAGVPVRLVLEENPTTGFIWQIDASTNECEIVRERRQTRVERGFVGAPSRLCLTITSKVQTPVRVELAYARPWMKGRAKPLKSVRLILYTAERVASARYPENDVLRGLRAECAARGIVITDWHLHMRGGMTPELGVDRERASGIRSTAMENHGREWEIFDNARLRAFAAKAKAAGLPAGIQVNDRDWFRQIDAATRAQFDYILADTMIMGRLPDGRDNRLWLVREIVDPTDWMNRYFRHVMTVLDEPIDIYANPTYLPAPLAARYDELWTEERMRAVIAKAVEKGIALEIQAGSSFPNLRFLRLAKAMGAKFSFGTNNFDPRPKDLARWLEAIRALDLKASDIWQPRRR